MTTLDEVWETVRGARKDGPDALAAMALSYGATMALGVVRCAALRGQLIDTERGMDEAREQRDEAQREAEALRVELDALAERLGAVTLERDSLRRQCEVTP